MHTNRRQEAKLLPPDTFLSRKNAFAGGAPPRTPLGELTALPQIPQLVMGEGPPGRGGKRKRGGGKGREGGKGSGRDGKGKCYPPRMKILATALLATRYSDTHIKQAVAQAFISSTFFTFYYPHYSRLSTRNILAKF